MEALRCLGLETCALDEIGSIATDGYAVISPPLSPGVQTDDFKTLVLKYPTHTPSALKEFFGIFKEPNGVATTYDIGQSPPKVDFASPKGIGFHNHLFVERLRNIARKEPNITIIHGTAVGLLEEAVGIDGSHRIVGLQYRQNSGGGNAAHSVAAMGTDEADTGGEGLKRVLAPLTIVADGMWSGLRKVVSETKANVLSTFVGFMLEHPEYATPLPHPYHGHVFLTRPSPMLMYQVKPAFDMCMRSTPAPTLPRPLSLSLSVCLCVCVSLARNVYIIYIMCISLHTHAPAHLKRPPDPLIPPRALHRSILPCLALSR